MSLTRKCYLIGSSHAVNLFRQAIFICWLTKNYELVNLGKPGATFFTLRPTLPHPSIFKPGDIIILATLGNGLFRKYLSDGTKNVFKTEKKINGRTKRTIHLRKTICIDPTVRKKELELVWDYFKEVKSTIVILDNFIRHLNCCSIHTDTSRFNLQLQENRRIRLFFEQKRVKNWIVVNHIKILSQKYRKYRRPMIYRKIFSDSVHFYPNIYRHFLQRLTSEVLAPAIEPASIAPTSGAGPGPRQQQ